MNTFFKDEVADCFIEAVKTTIEKYFGSKPSLSSPHMSKDLETNYKVAGYVQFETEELIGTMSIAFQDKFITKVYENMLGEQVDAASPEIEDCVGELTNIIYGFARSAMANQGYQLGMGRPVVTRTINEFLHGKKSLEMPFRFDKDKELSLVLSVVQLKKHAA